ncbi:hypothetical protein MCUN1_003626 [Malassezia cuniculi]|uniref:Peptidase M20 dimerisation domain-containing protein n=1 Tax=Malassezia cuniculi TaxID=948313 RepID=A0AAF0EYD3_9BASI|nr:hypothetical protein MCUN1_003626 [Malassezia cuniculi]
MSDKIVAHIEANQKKYVDRLAEAVGIPSVSGDASYRHHVFEMADWLANEFTKVGAQVTKRPLGKQEIQGETIDLPPALLGQIGNDPAKKTILVYGHFDVQPALKSDGWDSEPFKLVHDEATGRLYGRGSTDDKGPILGWLHVLEAHKELGLDLPVNLKFVFEGMEESGSEGLEELVVSEKNGFLAGVDAVCISDNYWLGTTKPCITHGLRGCAYFYLTVSGPARDLHSGVFGGVVHEPMTDLISIMSRLVTPEGKILIPGINEQVAPLTDAEREVYNVMDFSLEDINSATGSKTTISDDKVSMLMSRMRYPSLSLHGIEGAFAEPGAKTVIPAKVTGKFSIRMVPDMDGQKVIDAVKAYVEDEFKKLGSRNTIEFKHDSPGLPWVADPNVSAQAYQHWNYEAAFRATEKVYGVRPDLTREGGSIPITLTFADTLNCNVLLLPMGRSDDGAHSTNEKIDLSNYIKGTQLLGTYLYEVASA